MLTPLEEKALKQKRIKPVGTWVPWEGKVFFPAQFHLGVAGGLRRKRQD